MTTYTKTYYADSFELLTTICNKILWRTNELDIKEFDGGFEITEYIQ